MDFQAGLKGGLIGGALLFVLSLLSLIPVPFLSFCCCGLTILAYVGAGALAGNFLSPPRTAGAGAGAGAIAGVISGLVNGIVGMIISAIRMAIAGADVMTTMDPAMVQPLIDAGIDPELFSIFAGWGGVALGGGLCCLGSLVIGAALGAIGGAILAAAKSE